MQDNPYNLDLTTTHEVGHLVINAAKGRSFVQLEVWKRDDLGWVGYTGVDPEFQMSLEDELIALIAGIEAEAKIANELGLDGEFFRTQALKDDDREKCLELIRETGREDESDMLLQHAQQEAQALLQNPEIWELVLAIAKEIRDLVNPDPHRTWTMILPEKLSQETQRKLAELRESRL